MASQQSTVDFIVEQMQSAGQVTGKKMFGEYGIFCSGKMVALVCDDQLFIKPTPGGRAYLGEIEEAPPYPGANRVFDLGGPLDDGDGWRIGTHNAMNYAAKKNHKGANNG